MKIKKLLALLLALCLCLSLSACGGNSRDKDDDRDRESSFNKDDDDDKKEPEKEEELPLIETGVKIEDLKMFSDPQEDYKEEQISSNRKTFSYRNGKYRTTGVLSGEDVIEYAVTIPEVYGETYEDFKKMENYGLYDMPKELHGAFQVVFCLAAIEIVTGDAADWSMDEAYRAIVDGEELKTVNWAITIDLDTKANTATLCVKYRNQ